MIEIRTVNFNKFKIFSVEEKLLHRIFKETDKINVEDVLYIYINFDRNTKQNKRKAWIGHKGGEVAIDLSNLSYCLLKKMHNEKT